MRKIREGAKTAKIIIFKTNISEVLRSQNNSNFDEFMSLKIFEKVRGMKTRQNIDTFQCWEKNEKTREITECQNFWLETDLKVGEKIAENTMGQN